MTNYRITPVNHWNSNWAWWATRSYDYGGDTPIFYIATASHYNLVSGERLAVWGTAADTDNWNDFTTVTIGTPDITFVHGSAFPAGMIYVAAIPIYIITADEAAAAKADLHTFVRTFWKMVEPDHEFIDNWHIRELCKVLQAVTRGEILRLIVNIPPSSAKSLLESLFWPAWEWATNSGLRYLTASYGTHLTIRENLRVRDICASDSYQTHYHLRFTGDQNVKELFKTSRRGWRFATSVGGAGTGEHPDRIIIDDPLTAAQARSEAERDACRQWFKRTISSRGIARNTRMIVIMRPSAAGETSQPFARASTSIDRPFTVLRTHPDNSNSCASR